MAGTLLRRPFRRSAWHGGRGMNSTSTCDSDHSGMPSTVRSTARTWRRRLPRDTRGSTVVNSLDASASSPSPRPVRRTASAASRLLDPAPPRSRRGQVFTQQPDGGRAVADRGGHSSPSRQESPCSLRDVPACHAALMPQGQGPGMRPGSLPGSSHGRAARRWWGRHLPVPTRPRC
jgi:hypothetical protein